MSERRPRVDTQGQAQLTAVEENLNATIAQAKEVNPIEARHFAPKLEREEQTKLSSQELRKNIMVLKPVKVLFAVGQKFDEKFRDSYNYDKEYVDFVYEHQEEKGAPLEMWTKPYPGVPAEMWIIPANKSVSAPRYVQKQIDQMNYITRKYVDKAQVGSDFAGSYHGALEVENVVDRATTREVSKKVNVFMGR